MRNTICFLIVFFVLIASTNCSAQQTDLKRDDFVSAASFIVGTYQPKATDYSSKQSADAAKTFLKTLNDDQRKQATHKLDSSERRKWTNLPAPKNAGGIRFGDLNKTQIEAACELLRSVMSKSGYEKTQNIMLADDQLLRGGRPRPGFGIENFSIVIFDEPSEKSKWAVQLDGHHVGLNFAIEGDKLTMSPSFIGTQPSDFKLGETTISPLKGEIVVAYELVESLTDEQRKQAVVRSRRTDLRAGPGADGKIPKLVGVPCKGFSDEQQSMLLKLISNWTSNLPKTQADARIEQIKKELPEMRFAWNGATQKGSDISYSIQSPSLIIEYACQSLGGDPLQHIHTIYRNPKNEYGGQLDK